MNSNPSLPVSSSQQDIHPRLEEMVRRHQASPWQAELHSPTVDVFTLLAGYIDRIRPEEIILDSGCGTGQSTRLIAAAFPRSMVIGVDRSAHRLARLLGKSWPKEPWVYREDNAVWVRAELASFWRLTLGAGWPVQRHFLLYPNPWPKPGQFQRRWHGHPVFPTLVSLGGRLELRTNWEIYAREFQMAVRLVTNLEALIEPLEPSPITTPFEQKYLLSGHGLFVVKVAPGGNIAG